MNYKIFLTKNFEKEAKRFIKKYPSLKRELIELNFQLLANPHLGTSIGNNAYKIRLAVKSKGKGKSGGMRVISYLQLDLFIHETTNIFLLSIYDKSERTSITNEEIRRLIQSST